MTQMKQLVIINIRNQSNLRFLKQHKQQHEISNNRKKQQSLLRMLQAKQRVALINVKCNAGQVHIFCLSILFEIYFISKTYQFKGKPGTELGPQLLRNPFLLNNLENLSKN